MEVIGYIVNFNIKIPEQKESFIPYEEARELERTNPIFEFMAKSAETYLYSDIEVLRFAAMKNLQKMPFMKTLEEIDGKRYIRLLFERDIVNEITQGIRTKEKAVYFPLKERDEALDNTGLSSGLEDEIDASIQ